MGYQGPGKKLITGGYDILNRSMAYVPVRFHTLVCMSWHASYPLHPGGVMEPTAVEAWNFHEQFHTFHAHGYAQQMGTGQVVGNVVCRAIQ